jgi:hypothetical protein
LNPRFQPADYNRKKACKGPKRAGDSGMNGRLSLRFAAAVVLGLALPLVALAAPAEAAKRVALVIGNNDYKNVPKLQKAVNDARTMGDAL